MTSPPRYQPVCATVTIPEESRLALVKLIEATTLVDAYKKKLTGHEHDHLLAALERLRNPER